MIGVRLFSRGNGVPGAATKRRRALVLSALIAAILPAATSIRGDEPKGFRPSGSSRVGRTIKQTASPFEGEDEEEPSSAPRRERLTGPDPEIADLKEPLANVVVEGNKTISAAEILQKVKTRPGRLPDPKLVQDDVRALYATRWFFGVEARLSRVDGKPVLVFRVVERPMLQTVEYKGNKKIKTKELAELTGLKAGGAFDVGANKEAARRIENHYREKGYVHAKVELEKGESPDDREAIFVITEGPKVHVDRIKFTGNKEIRSDILKTQVKSKTRWFWLFGGKFDPATIPEDIASLKQYYLSLGYFDVKIKQKDEGLKKKAAGLTLEYEIAEGPRYKVRNVEFAGNRVIPEEQLRQDIRMLPGQHFNERFLNFDVEKITGQYGDLGRIFARIEATPRFLEEPGTVDLVYNINEDRPYRVGRVRIHIEGDHPHTKEAVILTRLRFRPGELASRDKIKKSEQALRNSQIFAGPAPGSPDGPRISVTPPDRIRGFDESSIVRGQDDGYGFGGQGSGPYVDEPPLGSDPFALPGQPPMFEDQPPGYLDYDVYATEAQTGRLMFGVGVNSNAGLVGNFVLEENNFDIFRPPASFAEIVNGTAWRGAGQQFRLEATPGPVVSRYLISWRDPYFLERNISLSTSGFYYTRFFPNWREQREGGRIAVGGQFNAELSSSLAVRVENVRISDPSLPVPLPLEEVLGDNFLSTVRANIVHDTRDSAFLPGKGHYLELAYEQGIADFVFPKAELDARQYFTVRERPDGRNRHIIAAVGQLGWTDNDTPIFEKFYAGGFQSFRGFAFYGVTPRVNGVRIGGRFQALGSLEYMLPVTADDTIQLVGFTDMGTVDDKVTFDRFRLTVGGGIRLTIPAMGPLPLAFDLGFPILREDFDNRYIPAFYMGFNR